MCAHAQVSECTATECVFFFISSASLVDRCRAVGMRGEMDCGQSCLVMLICRIPKNAEAWATCIEEYKISWQSLHAPLVGFRIV